jgi:hypothetical protein
VGPLSCDATWKQMRRSGKLSLSGQWLRLLSPQGPLF